MKIGKERLQRRPKTIDKRRRKNDTSPTTPFTVRFRETNSHAVPLAPYVPPTDKQSGQCYNGMIHNQNSVLVALIF